MTNRDEINSLINEYSFTLDSGDLEGFLDLFENGQWVFNNSKPCLGREELWQNVVSRVIIYDDGTPRTRHVSSNIEITISEDELTATSQRYVVVYQQTDELPLQVIYSGHYFDEFVKDAVGGWRFSKCTVRGPLTGNLSYHMR